MRIHRRRLAQGRFKGGLGDECTRGSSDAHKLAGTKYWNKRHASGSAN